MSAGTSRDLIVVSKGPGKSGAVGEWFARKYPTRRSRRGLRIFIIDGKAGDWPGRR